MDRFSACAENKHDWISEGGRPCSRCGGSQPVFVCLRCLITDYGDEKDSPGLVYCERNCAFEIIKWNNQ